MEYYLIVIQLDNSPMRHMRMKNPLKRKTETLEPIDFTSGIESLIQTLLYKKKYSESSHGRN